MFTVSPAYQVWQETIVALATRDIVKLQIKDLGCEVSRAQSRLSYYARKARVGIQTKSLKGELWVWAKQQPHARKTYLETKFWANVKKGRRCWEWVGKGGKYGIISGMPAQRFSWLIHYGDIPPKMDVCHKCDNPSCVKPSHLFVGTRADNIRDAAKKGRMCHGEKHRNNKLRAVDVMRIKRSDCSQWGAKMGLAKRFGVSRQNIDQILSGKSWRHVKP